MAIQQQHNEDDILSISNTLALERLHSGISCIARRIVCLFNMNSMFKDRSGVSTLPFPRRLKAMSNSSENSNEHGLG